MKIEGKKPGKKERNAWDRLSWDEGQGGKASKPRASRAKNILASILMEEDEFKTGWKMRWYEDGN